MVEKGEKICIKKGRPGGRIKIAAGVSFKPERLCLKPFSALSRDLFMV
jgi:hypothetical protein